MLLKNSWKFFQKYGLMEVHRKIVHKAKKVCILCVIRVSTIAFRSPLYLTFICSRNCIYQGKTITIQIFSRLLHKAICPN